MSRRPVTVRAVTVLRELAAEARELRLLITKRKKEAGGEDAS
jgi:hypothetical protein